MARELLFRYPDEGKELNMEREELYRVMSANPAVHLATIENGEPRVRAVFLYRADDKGIIFHIGTFKEMYAQISKDPKVEMCFNDYAKGIQIRVRGKLTEIDDDAFKDEIAETPGREFLKKMRDGGAFANFYKDLHVYKLSHGLAQVWTMETNMAPKKMIQL